MAPWLIAVIVVAPLLLVALLVLWGRRSVAAAREHLARIAAGRVAKRATMAQSFGLRSLGAGQLRGVGQLALFDDEIVFVQAVASHHVRAKRSDIVGVTTPRSFLGKTQGVKLLAVEWRTADGGTEQIALRVPEVDAWVADLGGVSAG